MVCCRLALPTKCISEWTSHRTRIESLLIPAVRYSRRPPRAADDYDPCDAAVG